MITILDQLLLAATIDAVFRLKWGRVAWTKAHPRLAAAVAALLDGRSGCAAAFAAAERVYGAAW